MTRPLLALAVTATLASAGCSSVGGSAVRTGAVRPPPYAGVVALYASGVTPPGVEQVGVVEVHAVEGEATIEALLPAFVRKVTQLGGTIAVLDGADTRFDIVPVSHTESYAVPCGYRTARGGMDRGMCLASRTIVSTAEMMTLTLRGRAFVPATAAATSRAEAP